MEYNLTKGISPQFKSNYLRLIASGHIERTALAILEVDWIDFFDICAKDPVFRSEIDEARKSRADHWVDRIADSVDHKYTIETTDEEGKTVHIERPPTKDETARDKLVFEKLKFLAQADNPDKYSSGAKSKVALEFDMSEFKLLPVEEARKVLQNDPFAKTIEAEFTENKNV